jgi:hypothetical protein
MALTKKREKSIVIVNPAADDVVKRSKALARMRKLREEVEKDPKNLRTTKEINEEIAIQRGRYKDWRES